MLNQSARTQLGGSEPDKDRTRKMIIDVYKIGFLPIKSDNLP